MTEKQPVVTFNVDLASLSLTDLAAVYSALDAAGDLFNGIARQPRCIAGWTEFHTAEYTPGGEFLMDLDEAFCALQTAVRDEAWRRNRPKDGLQRGAQTEVALSLFLTDDDFPLIYARFVAGMREPYPTDVEQKPAA